MMKLLSTAAAAAALAATSVAAEQDLAKLQGTSYVVDSVEANVAGTQEDSASPIGVIGSPDAKLHAALFSFVEAIDKYDAKSAGAGYKTSTARALIPELTTALSGIMAPNVEYIDECTDNPLQQYIAWGGKMDYSSGSVSGVKEVGSGLAAYYLDLANPVMMGAGPNQIANIDYGKAAGVKYLVATVENFKPLALKDLYVDFSLSLDGEEFYYQIYELAMAVNSKGEIVAMGTTNGRDRSSLMRDKVLPKVIAAAKKAEGGMALAETQLAEVRRSYVVMK
jgi:hypothetical protein